MKQVLSPRRTADATVGIFEDWSWGPIGDHRLADRIEFMRREDPTPWGDYWDSMAERHAEFWKRIEDWDGDRLIWLGSRSASELAGYLHYLDRYHHLSAAVVRPDDYLPPHPRHGVAGATGVLNADQMADVADNAERRPVARDAHLFGRWAELVEENAMLRVLEDDQLVSASIDHHDHFILAAARQEWMRHVRVIGQALGNTFDAKTWVSDALLFSRLGHLVDDGMLEADGDVRAYTEDFRRSDARVRLANPISRR